MQTLWPIAPVSIASIPDAESTRALAMNVGGTPPRALLVEVDPGVDHQLLAARAGAEDDADLLAVLVGDLEAGVGERLLAGGDAELHRASRSGGPPSGPSSRRR